MAYVLFLAALMGVAYFVSRNVSTNAPIRRLWQRYRWWVGLGLLMPLLLSRGGFLAVVVLIGLLGFGIWTFAKKQGNNPWRLRVGNLTIVCTRYLWLHLNDQQQLSAGWVLRGTFKGRRLASLSPADWKVLRQESDPHTHQIIHELNYAPQDAPPTSSSGQMTLAQAYALLELNPGASVEAIRQAHRRLMQRHHPDHGGDTDQAAQLNQAKDLLLRRPAES